MAEKRNILLLVEGEKTDVRVMQLLLQVYQLDINFKIVPYRTNIYTLYGEMFADQDADDFDLRQVLKSREKDPDRKLLLDQKYTDILLIFDLDPHDPLYDAGKIRQMQDYFCMSSDMGKLYLNYPMIEAFYHCKTLPDAHYLERFATLDELYSGSYKQRVNFETYKQDYRKFIQSRADCNTVILQNLQKALWLIQGESPALSSFFDWNIDKESYLYDVLSAELALLENHSKIAVLCTCCLFIWEYQPALLAEDAPLSAT